VLSAKVLELLSETLKEFSENTISFEKSGLPEAEESIIKEYREFFKSFRARGIVTEVKVRQPVLVQLLLRSVVGVGARADVLVYLLFNNSGSSNSIAKEVFYDQKNVYRILERWAGAGVVTKIAGKKIANYSLSNREQWFRLLQLKESLTYLNWAKTFFMCDRLANALVTPPWSDDEYLLSSFFRDLLSDVKPIAKSLNIQIPEPSAYAGPEYFAPLASTMLHILKKLRSHHT
jgi:DNA-binding MarR family transcriptional regulator